MTKIKEVVAVDAVRSAIGKSGNKGMEKNGQLCHISAMDLLADTMRGLLDRVKAKAPKFDEKEIEDVYVGCISQVGEQGGNIARIASVLAGIPEEVCGCTVNQYCNSGLKGIMMASQAIKAGEGDIMLCAGVEIMSHYGMGSDIMAGFDAKYPVHFSPRFEETKMHIRQGPCAEMVAEDEGFTREDLDKFGMWSMKKAVEAERQGLFTGHIIPIEYEYDGKTIRVEKDEILRPGAVDDPDAYMQAMAGLKPPFKEGGMVTAGNSSQIVDGSAATLLMTADKAEELGLEPLCRITSCAVEGGAVVPMMLTPIPASKKVMARAGKTIDDIDIIEPNEAFAVPCLSLAKALGYEYDDPRVNPTGGAIALGHPIGASGVMYFGEMAHHLKNTNARAGMQVMCGGGGLAIAAIIEAV